MDPLTKNVTPDSSPRNTLKVLPGVSLLRVGRDQKGDIRSDTCTTDHGFVGLTWYATFGEQLFASRCSIFTTDLKTGNEFTGLDGT